MTAFNLVHCLLHPSRPHGLTGYTEVIETLAWGLGQLGHEVRRSVNEADPACVNIIFGAQVLPLPVLARLPPDSIVYNFEQLRHLPLDHIRHEMHAIAARFRIWDYSPGNLEAWQRLGARHARLVPIGYAPILTRIPSDREQDIDVLLYGGSDEKRLRAFHLLAEAGLSVVYLCGLYGAARDSLIARAKLVLNVNRYDRSRVFEIVRVSYLLANRKAVISIYEPDTVIDDDIKTCIRLTSFDQLVANCRILAENTAARALLAEHGFDTFARRDIREILRQALLP